MKEKQDLEVRAMHFLKHYCTCNLYMKVYEHASKKFTFCPQANKLRKQVSARLQKSRSLFNTEISRPTRKAPDAMKDKSTSSPTVNEGELNSFLH